MRLGLQVWGSEGDVAPFTALAAGLVKAGHEVKLVVTDNLGRDYSGLARRFGYEGVSTLCADRAPRRLGDHAVDLTHRKTVGDYRAYCGSVLLGDGVGAAWHCGKNASADRTQSRSAGTRDS